MFLNFEFEENFWVGNFFKMNNELITVGGVLSMIGLETKACMIIIGIRNISVHANILFKGNERRFTILFGAKTILGNTKIETQIFLSKLKDPHILPWMDQ